MDPRVDYLHDALVSSVTFDGWPERSIWVRLVCDSDTGDPAMNAKRATVHLRDVFASRYVQWPVSGPETLDSLRQGISAELAASIRSKPDPSAVRVTLAFHSGAALEVICSELILQLE
jgi:hypothetical protein